MAINPPTNRPVLGVSALIVDDGRVLLVERAREPLKGYWSLPGGHVEGGETLGNAVAREVLEETGIIVSDIRQIDIREILGGAGQHFVLVVFAARPHHGEPTAGDDAAAARWVNLEDITGLHMTEDSKRFIARHTGKAR